MRLCVLLVTVLLAGPASGDFREFSELLVDPALQARLRRAAEESLREFPGLKAEDLAITLVDMTKPMTIGRADFHGELPFYPASVIKLFYMADIYMQKQQDLGDVDRALREMIVVSDNDATAYLVDILADTCPGAELQGRALRRFVDRRRQINRHFERLGYDISAMMKPWSFGPYGRELQLLGENRINRNRLTANATAALLLWIARRRVPGSDAMMDLLWRPLDADHKNGRDRSTTRRRCRSISSTLHEPARWAEAFDQAVPAPAFALRADATRRRPAATRDAPHVGLQADERGAAGRARSRRVRVWPRPGDGQRDRRA